jgi:hypothetical protein
MSTKPQLGKNIFNDELSKGRQATASLRAALDKLVEEPGPQTRAVLIAKAALSLSKLEAVLNQLDEIGRNARKNSNLNT